MQTKKQSFIESITNILVGYSVSILSQLAVFPLFDIDIPIQDNLMIGIYFTAISLARSYLLRRYFNKRNTK